MAEDLSTTQRSRRGLLTAAVGAAAAAVAASVARVVPASAEDGDLVHVGEAHTGENVTSFQAEDSWALSAESTATRAFNARSETGQGIHGESTYSAGVAGVSDEGNGVHGTSRHNRGLWGESTYGTGVEGFGAVGVKAESLDGYALHTVAGRVRLDGISGIAIIPEGETVITLEPPVPVSKETFVLLTPQANLHGVSIWYTKDTDNGEISIHVSEARKNNAKIAYLILEQAAVD